MEVKESKKHPKIPQLVSRRSELRQAGSKQSSLKGVLVSAEDLLTSVSKFLSNLRV